MHTEWRKVGQRNGSLTWLSRADTYCQERCCVSNYLVATFVMGWHLVNFQQTIHLAYKQVQIIKQLHGNYKTPHSWNVKYENLYIKRRRNGAKGWEMGNCAWTHDAIFNIIKVEIWSGKGERKGAEHSIVISYENAKGVHGQWKSYCSTAFICRWSDKLQPVMLILVLVLTDSLRPNLSPCPCKSRPCPCSGPCRLGPCPCPCPCKASPCPCPCLCKSSPCHCPGPCRLGPCPCPCRSRRC